MNKAERLIKEISELTEELHKHQNKCKHPERHRFHKLRASTGNYDPTQDSYWTIYYCDLCKKKWTEDGQSNTVGTRIDSPYRKSEHDGKF